MMKKILHIVHKMGRGGIETFIMNLYRNINRLEFQFDFLVHTKDKGDYDDEIRNLGGRIFYLDSRSEGIWWYKKNIDKFLEKYARDYIAIHQHASSLTSIDFLVSAKKHGIPIRIIHSHSSSTKGCWIHKILHRINKHRICHVATHFFACSETAAEWCFSGSKAYEKVFIIKNGIDVDAFLFNAEKRKEIRNMLGIKSDCLVWGHVGRFSEVKNHLFLINVFSAFLKYNPGAVLLLVGDGELFVKIKKIVYEKGLEANILFLGLRTDIADLLCAMDIFIFPSLYEGLPLSLLEAQACGLKLYCSDTVSKEVDATGNVDFISLLSSVDGWAKHIDKDIVNIKRIDQSCSVKLSGYDIKLIAQMFEQQIYGEK